MNDDDVFNKVMARAAEARERPVVVPLNAQANGGQPATEGEPETWLDRYRARLVGAKALTERPPPPHLIDGLLYRSTMAVLYGPPGGGKSFVALDWALSLASRLPWNGREAIGGPVLYVNGEGSGGLGKRIRAWLDRSRIEDVPDFHALPEAVSLLRPEQAQALAELAAELKAALVVIDTMARAMVGGDENSAEDVGTVVDAADRVRRTSGATVLLVHHSTKDRSNYRGSSALEGAADTMVELETAGEPGKRRLTLVTHKQKDADQGAPVLLRLTAVTVTICGQSDTSCVLESHIGSETTGAADRLRLIVSQMVPETGMAPGELLKVASEKDGMSRATYYRAQNDLLKQGVITNVGSDARPRYKLASEGKNELSHAVSPESHGSGHVSSQGGGLREAPPETRRDDETRNNGPPVEDVPPPDEPMGGEEP